MRRLIVTNSALAYPRVPDEVMRPGDVVLPLVERFEDALFMPGAFSDELPPLFPEFNLRTRALGRSLGSLLPEWLGRARPEWGHSAWDACADYFVKFALGPVLGNLILAERAAQERPAEVLAWELPDDPGWWTGRQMVVEIAEVIATRCGARLTTVSSRSRRVARDLLAPLIPPVQATRLLGGYGHLPRGDPPDRADVLFAILGPTLVPLFDRIGVRLQSEHGLRVAGVDLPAGPPGEAITPGDLQRYRLHNLLEPAMMREAQAVAMAGPHAVAEVLRALAEFAPLTHVPRELRAVLTRRLHASLTRDLSLGVLHARLWQRALDALRPAAVVGFVHYNELMAPLVLQARHRGIPTLYLQHGICGPLFRAEALLPYDDLVVFGEYARVMLAPLAQPDADFTLTGHSVYDDLTAGPTAGMLREQLLGQRRHLVLVTTQPIEINLRAYERRWWLEVLAEACVALDARMAIKPHPREDPGLYESLAERWPAHVSLIPHGAHELSALIGAADVLVTRFSTTVFEAALLDRPAMTVNLAGGEDQYPFAAEGAALGVYAEEQLLPTLRRLLRDATARARLARSRRQFLDRHIGPRDGRATERIAALIAERARGG